jgi:predicted alpha/beta hydrolase
MIENDQLTVSFRDGSFTELTVMPSDDPNAPVVVCLPAMGVSAGYYEVLGDALADAGFHAVLADLRGNGTSSVRASRQANFGYAEILEMELPAIVKSVCEELGTDQVMILGHSLGGQLGVLFAAQSSQVSHVVLVASGSGWYRKVPGRLSARRFVELQLLFAVTLVHGFLPEWFPFAGREARRLIRDWGYECMTGRYRVARTSVDYEAALGASEVPALFLAFPDDPYVPDPCWRHLASKLTAADVAEQRITPEELRMKKSDHFRWVLRPQPVVDRMQQWLREQPTVGPQPVRSV